MEKIMRQCVGIDVSKDTLDVAISLLKEDFQVAVLATEQFVNNDKGIKMLIRWIKKFCLKELTFQVVLEATGVYHEKLAYILVENDIEISIVLPNKIRNYCRSTNVRTVTDNISAKQIAEFGLVKKLNKWEKPAEVFLQLKNLCRERLRLIKEKTAIGNQEHAYEHSSSSLPNIEKRTKEHIKFINVQIKEIEKDIEAIVNQYEWLKEKLQIVCSLVGVKLITAVTVIAETNGFNLIRNAKQLVCYAGYDVVQKQSGTSVNVKPRISHKGNKYIRRALHFPALTVVKHDEYFRNFYERLYDKNKIKMKGYVAVQRKLLVLIYTLWKNNEIYNPHKYFLKKSEQPSQAALTELDQVRSRELYTIHLNAKVIKK